MYTLLHSGPLSTGQRPGSNVIDDKVTLSEAEGSAEQLSETVGMQGRSQAIWWVGSLWTFLCIILEHACPS